MRNPPGRESAAHEQWRQHLQQGHAGLSARLRCSNTARLATEAVEALQLAGKAAGRQPAASSHMLPGRVLRPPTQGEVGEQECDGCRHVIAGAFEAGSAVVLHRTGAWARARVAEASLLSCPHTGRCACCTPWGRSARLASALHCTHYSVWIPAWQRQRRHSWPSLCQVSEYAARPSCPPQPARGSLWDQFATAALGWWS